MSKEFTCKRCNTSLVLVPCGFCGGNGKISKWLFLKGTCHVCNGRGTYIKCPNESEHFLEDLRKRYNIPTLKTERMYVVKPQESLADLTKKGTIPSPEYLRRFRNITVPPWSPQYPCPWHPAHPRNPNKTFLETAARHQKMSQEAMARAQKMAAQARKRRPF